MNTSGVGSETLGHILGGENGGQAWVRSGKRLQFANWKLAHRNRGFTQLETGGSFHSFLYVYQAGYLNQALLEFIGLVYGKIYRNPPIFNGKNHGFRFRFSLKPIQ